MNGLVFIFGGWDAVVRILFMAVLGYLALIVMLRIAGNRTLAHVSAVDFIFLAAIGSAFGRAITAQEVGIIDAVVAFGALLTVQYLVTWTQVRWPSLRKVVINRPVLLYFRGEYRLEAMRRHRITEVEVQAALRQQGFHGLHDVEAVVLESSGSLSVLREVTDYFTLEP